LGISIGLVLLVLAVVGIMIFRNGMNGLSKAGNDSESQGHELTPVQYQRQQASTPIREGSFQSQPAQTPPNGYNADYFDSQGNFSYDSPQAKNTGAYL
jgi:hypothetical protein